MPNNSSPAAAILPSTAASVAISLALCSETPAMPSMASSTRDPPPPPTNAPIAPPNNVPNPGAKPVPTAAPLIAPVTPPANSGNIPAKSDKSFLLNPSSSIRTFLSVRTPTLAAPLGVNANLPLLSLM